MLSNVVNKVLYIQVKLVIRTKCFSNFVPIKRIVQIRAHEITIKQEIVNSLALNWNKVVNTLMLFWLIWGKGKLA